MHIVGGELYTSGVEREQETTKMGIVNDETGKDPGATELLPWEGAGISTDPAALPAAEKAIAAEINEGAREATDAPNQRFHFTR